MKNKGFIAGIMAAGIACAAHADSAPQPNPFSSYAKADRVILAVETPFVDQTGNVRLSVYDGEETFLEKAASKHEAAIDPEGNAIIDLGALPEGVYAFVAYFDENGDGKLNRGKVLGKPKEPLAFSNGAKPKLRAPRFDEAMVDVELGAVVVLTIED